MVSCRELDLEEKKIPWHFSGLEKGKCLYCVLMNISDIWEQAVWCDGLDHSHLCGLVHIWWCQRSALYLCQVQASFCLCGINTKNVLPFWLKWKMWAYVVISVRLAGQLSVCGKNLNIASFSEAINMVNVKLSMMVVLTELYPFISLSVTLIVFLCHSTFEQFSLKILCSYLVELKFLKIVDYLK